MRLIENRNPSKIEVEFFDDCYTYPISLLTSLEKVNLTMCMYVKYSVRRQVRPSTCTTRVVYISVYYTKERNEVVCQILSSLSHWPCRSTSLHTQIKSAANTTTKHRLTSNSSETVTDINATEPSWELQILL